MSEEGTKHKSRHWRLWFMTTGSGIVLILTTALIIHSWGTLGYIGEVVLGLLAFCTLTGLTYGLIRIGLDIKARRLALRMEEEKHHMELDEIRHRQDLERERQTHELEMERQQFTVKAHLLLTRVQPNAYLLDLPQGTRITALPHFPTTPAKQHQIETPTQQRPTLPGPYDLVEMYHQYPISPEKIFLGKDEKGEPIFIAADQLCHGAFNAMTGMGKTIVEQGLISQLLHIGHTVILADLKFALVTESGIDYRPLAKKMLAQPELEITPEQTIPCLVRHEAVIAILLHFLAYAELQRRIEMRAKGDFSYPTLDVFLEEMVALMLAFPQCANDITRLIALGRELRINLFTAAQNFLVKDTKLSGGARENFQTAYFLGGDEYSGALLLDLSKKNLTDYLRMNNIVLGKGIGLLRNNARLPQATLVRLGFASNESVYYHHGRADTFTLPPSEPPTHTTRILKTNTDPEENPLLARARTLWHEGHNSDRKLQKAMGITLYQANQLARHIREEETKQPAMNN